MIVSLAPMRKALGHRPFALYLGTTLLADAGYWIAVVAQGWLVLELTHSALWLGLVAAASQIPALVCAFVGGSFADRYDRRTLVAASNAGICALTVVTAVLIATHGIALWSLIALALLTGTLVSGEHPVDRALIADLADVNAMQPSVALSSLEFAVARFAGPALGGAVIAGLGVASGYALYAAAVVPLAVLAAQFRRRNIGDRTKREKAASATTFADTRRYLLGERTILGVCALVFAFTIGVSPYVALLPDIAKNGFGLDERGYGLLSGVAGVGALVGAFSLALCGELPKKGRVLAIAVFAAGGTLTLFAMQHNVLLAGALLAVLGAIDSVVYATANTYIQERTDPRHRGRVNAVFTAAFLGGIPLGNAAAGIAAGHLGSATTLAASGVLAAASAVAFWFLDRDAREASSTTAPAEA